MQNTNTVVMVEPDNFSFNSETALTNRFQHKLSINNIAELAKESFKKFVDVLVQQGITVLILKNPTQKPLADAVFPNNWFTVFPVNNRLTLILYPMLNHNRRLERCQDTLIKLLFDKNIMIEDIIDLTYFEKNNQALEGTGSVVFDHQHQIVYVSTSPRSDRKVLEVLLDKILYKPVIFHSYDKEKQLIYHTNVMLSVGDNFAVICKESIIDAKEQHFIYDTFKKTNKTIIEITLAQMYEMAGNILQLRNAKDYPIIVMSQKALITLTKSQKNILSKYGMLIYSDLNIIETIGGGGARCMIAEIFK